MDDQHFDELVRSISSGVSRRRALRTALAGLVTGVAGVTALSAEAKQGKGKAEGKKKAKAQGKNKGKQGKAQGKTKKRVQAQQGGNENCPAGTSSERYNFSAAELDANNCVIKGQTVGTCSCNIQACFVPKAGSPGEFSGFYFGAATTCTNPTVILKGGNDNTGPSGNCTAASPCNAPSTCGQNNNQCAISNYTFCGYACPEVTTTTPGQTTTTTKAPATTTTAGPGTTTTAGPGTTTTAGPGTTTTAPPQTTTTKPPKPPKCVSNKTCHDKNCGSYKDNCGNTYVCGGGCGHKQICVVDEHDKVFCKPLPSDCAPNGHTGICCSGFHRDGGICCDRHEAGAVGIIVSTAVANTITVNTPASTPVSTVPPTTIIIPGNNSIGGAGRRRRRRRRKGGRRRK
jgi:hypothetical protein